MILSALALLLSATPAHAEPVSTAIGVTAFLVETFGFSTAVAGFLGGLGITVGATLGISAVSSLLTPGKQPEQPSNTNTNTNEQRFNERQSVPPKRIIYGTAQVGGALFFEQVVPPYLYQGVMICAKPITRFKKVWIGTNLLSLPVYQPGIVLNPLGQSSVANFTTRTQDYVDDLQLCVRLGLPNQAADPIIAGAFTNLGAEFRQRGIATAVLRYYYGANQTEFIAKWGQVSRPNPSFLIDGVAVPDPRDPSQILNWDPDDPASVAAAEATWKFSNNASLCQVHYLTQRYGGRIKPQKIDWAKVAEAADYDDTPQPCKDGAIKRHTIDGVVTLNEKPFDVMGGMLTANRGFIMEATGKVWVSSSKPKDPVGTIHDGILVEGLQYRASKPKKELINKVRSRFISPEREYVVADGPILSRADLQAADDELLEATLALPFTLDHRRAQRLAKAALETTRKGRMMTCMVKAEFLADISQELIGNPVNFNSQLFSQCNGIYLVTAMTLAPSGDTIELSLAEYDKTIESNWNPATDEQPFVLTPPDLS